MKGNTAPIFISAEAVLKPAKGGKSILEATRSDLANLKQFNAAPQSVKKGVELLKADGFTVITIGKSIIGFRGFRWQFEQAFEIKLQATASGLTIEGAKRFGIFERSGTDRYQELFAGFKLSRAGIKPLGSPFKSTKPPKVGQEGRIKTQLTPGQLAKMLGGGEMYRQYLKASPAPGKKIKVAVLDSGYYEHGHFTELNKNVEIIEDSRIGFLREEKEKVKGEMGKVQTLHEHLKNIIFLKGRLKTEDKIEKELVVRFEKTIQEAKAAANILLAKGLNRVFKELDSVEDMLKHVKSWIDESENFLRIRENSLEVYSDYADYNKHGTNIIPQLLAIARHASVEVFKVFTEVQLNNQWEFNNNSLSFILNQVTQRGDIHIVSNSWGDDENQLKEETPMSSTDLAVLLAPPSQILLFSAGNYTTNDKRKPENLREKEAEFPNTISVGGAYREGADRYGEVIASNGSFGYPFSIFGQDRFVPDICGWVGKNNSDAYNLWVPTFSKEKQKPPEDAWDSSWGGTSSSTAQLAGVCAVIKYFWPGANTEQVREVLRESADIITTGNSAQKVEMTGRAGLVNIELAIMTAREYSLDQQISFYKKG